jgi:lipopolysaccharide biosynthesis glycosyltransferase
VRLLIPEDFEHEERILYLDADVLVLSDVLALRDVPLEDAIAAVAPNGPAPFIEDFNRIHGRPAGTPVFNAGVMLLQPRRWTEARIADRSVEWLVANEAKLIFRNQDALNILLQDRLRWLNAAWNVESRLHREWVLGYSPRSALVGRAAIVHYTGGDKPWIPGRHVCWQSQYNRYLEACREAMRRTGGDVRGLPRPWTARDHIAAVANVVTVGTRVRLGALKHAGPGGG